ncbi:hypothetical protein CEXT_538841, partial [Caerostris extrusa]
HQLLTEGWLRGDSNRTITTTGYTVHSRCNSLIELIGQSAIRCVFKRRRGAISERNCNCEVQWDDLNTSCIKLACLTNAREFDTRFSLSCVLDGKRKRGRPRVAWQRQKKENFMRCGFSGLGENHFQASDRGRGEVVWSWMFYVPEDTKNLLAHKTSS